jgi:hypothetical protein
MKRLQWALTYYCQFLMIAKDAPSIEEARAQARAVHVELGRPNTNSDEEVCHGQADAGPPPPSASPPPEPTKPPPVEPAAPADEGSGISTPQMASIGVAGLGVIALGIGIYYGLEARSLDNEITNHPVDEPWPVDLRDLEARGESYNRRAIVLMAGGGILAAAGVAGFFLFRETSPAPDTVTFAPAIAPDTLGFAASGRF